MEKFKNSSIMDEREAWRPRIFYSSGPDQGKPETFPAPTHLRRKERSSHNRGALYVPGVNNNSGGGGSSSKSIPQTKPFVPHSGCAIKKEKLARLLFYRAWGVRPGEVAPLVMVFRV